MKTGTLEASEGARVGGNGGYRTFHQPDLGLELLHVVDGLTVDRIAHMYGVVRSTVTRWLTGAREAVIDKAKRVLRDELSVPADEFESLARLLASQLDLSVSQVLAASATPSRA